MILKNVSGQKVFLYAVDPLTGLGATGLATNDISGYYSLEGSDRAAAGAVTEVTNGGGLYIMVLNAAMTNGNSFAYWATHATAKFYPVTGFTEQGYVAGIKTQTDLVTLARMGALTDLVDGGRLDLLIDAIKAQTDKLPMFVAVDTTVLDENPEDATSSATTLSLTLNDCSISPTAYIGNFVTIFSSLQPGNGVANTPITRVITAYTGHPEPAPAIPDMITIDRPTDRPFVPTDRVVIWNIVNNLAQVGSTMVLASTPPTVGQIRTEMESGTGAVLPLVKAQTDKISNSIALETTIADEDPNGGTSVDKFFTLTNGPDGIADDNMYRYMAITVRDISGNVKSTRRIESYTAATRLIEVDYPFTFPLAVGDEVIIWADTYSTTAGEAVVSEIADAVWDEDETAHRLPGTTGRRLSQSGGRY